MLFKGQTFSCGHFRFSVQTLARGQPFPGSSQDPVILGLHTGCVRTPLPSLIISSVGLQELSGECVCCHGGLGLWTSSGALKKSLAGHFQARVLLRRIGVFTISLGSEDPPVVYVSGKFFPAFIDSGWVLSLPS